MAAAEVLSKRGQRMSSSAPEQDRLPEGFMKAYNNPYSKENPQGIINLGTAGNTLVHDIVKERLLRPENLILTSQMMNYGTSFELSEATAGYLNWVINPRMQLAAGNIVVTSGVTGGLDCLMHLICDPGDAVLLATPYYGMFASDCERMAEAKLIHVDTYSNNKSGPFRPSIEDYKKKYEEAKEKGCNVRAVLVTNPHNPTGLILTRQEVEDLVQFCHQNSLHLVMDEIYMKSILDPAVKFTSVLELELPNPEMVHVLWGFSKDFGLPGFYVGCIVCPGLAIPRAAQRILFYYATSTFARHLLTSMIKDKDWLINVYFPKQTELLRAGLKIVTDALDSVEVDYIVPKAGLFVMADLRKYVTTEEGEMEVYDRCLSEGVYVSPGCAFYIAEHGWFRIVFCIPLDVLRVGMERFCAVIKKSQLLH